MEISKQIELLRPYVSNHKQELIEKVLSNRTRNLTVVLEDIYHPQNASATIRTSECLGIQDIHIIEDKNEFQLSPRVVHGAGKWVSIFRYNKTDHQSPTKVCLSFLKKNGYKILATSLSDKALDLDEYKPKGRSAVVFGNELSGISSVVRAEADHLIRIPMFGFTESFNLSVSVAMVLHSLSGAHRKMRLPWTISLEEQKELRLKWYKSVVRNSELILERG